MYSIFIWTDLFLEVVVISGLIQDNLEIICSTFQAERNCNSTFNLIKLSRAFQKHVITRFSISGYTINRAYIMLYNFIIICKWKENIFIVHIIQLMKMDILESNEQIVESLTNPMWGIMDRVNDNNNVGFKNIRNRHSSFYGKEHLFPTNIKFFVMAGFYYIGPFDKVKCAWCNGMLYNWEEGDIPSKEHIKHFPKCEYYVLGKDQSSVQKDFYMEFQTLPLPKLENFQAEFNPILITN
jgi:hypothetical protein